MGKPFSLSVALNSLATENRVTTRSSDNRRDNAPNTYDNMSDGGRRSSPTAAHMLTLPQSNSFHLIGRIHRSKIKQNGDVSTKKIEHETETDCLETPEFRLLEELEPLRTTPRLQVEECSDEAYLKRHEKYEKQEKFVKRRDRIRQREELYRLHLMKVAKLEADDVQSQIEAIEIVDKLPRKKRRQSMNGK